MTNLDKAFDLTTVYEGGDKTVVDSGGLTKWGVSKKAFPDLDIEKLTKDDAKAIFKKEYWDRVRGDELPWPLCFNVADAAYNMGSATAIKCLQKAISVPIDGIIGRATMQRLKAADPVHTSATFNAQCALAYTGMRRFDEYGKGWLNRLFLRMADGVKNG